MRRRRVKIRVKILVLETVPLQIEMRRRRVKIRVKIIVLVTVQLQIEMRIKVKVRVKNIVVETAGSQYQNYRFGDRPDSELSD